jgi:carbon storage regulator
MLVLSRKSGEAIVIGDQIVIEVVAILPGRVRLGFKAPREVLIRRNELVLDEPGGEEAPAADKPQRGSR